MVPHSILKGVPTVSFANVPDYCQDFDPNIDISELRSHALEAQITNAGVTHFGPGAEALLTIAHPDGSWGKHTMGPKPTWAYCEDNEDYGQAVAEWYKIPYGRPADVEQTHWTRWGPPGVGQPLVPPAAEALGDIQGLLVNTGRDIWAKMQGMWANVLAQQTATGSSSSSLTATGTPFVASAYVGYIVVDNTTGVWGLITANTTSVLTVDRWYNPATPAGAPGSTPGTTDKFTIVQSAPPAQFIAVSTTSSAPVATDTTMAGEITTAGGGFLRTQATFTHSAGTNTYTMANTFTANGSDTGSLPYVIYRMGLFNGMVVGTIITMMFETSLNASATITVSGDALTVTDTITGS